MIILNGLSILLFICSHVCHVRLAARTQGDQTRWLASQVTISPKLIYTHAFCLLNTSGTAKVFNESFHGSMNT